MNAKRAILCHQMPEPTGRQRTNQTPQSARTYRLNTLILRLVLVWGVFCWTGGGGEARAQLWSLRARVEQARLRKCGRQRETSQSVCRHRW